MLSISPKWMAPSRGLCGAGGLPSLRGPSLLACAGAAIHCNSTSVAARAAAAQPRRLMVKGSCVEFKLRASKRFRRGLYTLKAHFKLHE